MIHVRQTLFSTLIFLAACLILSDLALAQDKVIGFNAGIILGSEDEVYIAFKEMNLLQIRSQSLTLPIN